MGVEQVCLQAVPQRRPMQSTWPVPRIDDRNPRVHEFRGCSWCGQVWSAELDQLIDRSAVIVQELPAEPGFSPIEPVDLCRQSPSRNDSQSRRSTGRLDRRQPAVLDADQDFSFVDDDRQHHRGVAGG